MFNVMSGLVLVYPPEIVVTTLKVTTSTVADDSKKTAVQGYVHPVWKCTAAAVATPLV